MDRFEIAALRSYYGALLTKRQNDMLRLRYDEDLSLGEIADVYSVSRQAVADGIAKGEKALAEYDVKLDLMARDKALKAVLNEIAENAEGNRAVLDGLREIKRILEE